jgi:hypothetical protein
MLYVALTFLTLSVIAAIAIGLKYLLATSYTPYHAQVTGKPWEQVEPRLQVIIIGMMRIIGAGFLSLGASVAWFSYALFLGARWAPWALASVALIALLVPLWVALQLRKTEPRADTPVVPSAVGIGLILLGAAAGLFA